MLKSAIINTEEGPMNITPQDIAFAALVFALIGRIAWLVYKRDCGGGQ